MKNKIKKWCIYIGIGLMLLSWLVDLERQGFKDLVDLEYGWLYGQEQVQISVPKIIPVEVMIKRTFKEDYKMALAISQAENGTRECDRVSATGDIGVFQISYKWHSQRGNLFDCQDNIRVAYEIYKEQGWSPWVVYKNKKYLKFLN